MLEIREEQLEAMRQAVRAGAPEATLQGILSRGASARLAAGAVVITDPRGYDTRLGFRKDGAPESLALPSGQEYRFETDDQARLTALTHSGGQRVELDHDEQGRITSLRACGGVRYDFGYDAWGTLRTLRHPDGAQSGYEHDAGGNLVATVDRCGARTEHERDKTGELVAVRDPLGRVTTFETSDGKLAAVAHPDGTREEFAFDQEANAGQLTRRDGSQVYHELNHAGAVSALVWSEKTWVAFDYDEDDRLIGVRNAARSIRFDLDGGGETIREKTADGVVRMHHDSEGRLTKLVTPHGDSLGYEYDEDGRLAIVVDWQGRRQRFVYADDGTVKQIRYGNGLVEQQRYGATSKLERARVADARGRLVSEQHYRYDACGRLNELEDAGTVSEPAWLRRFAYDAEGRLTSAVDGLTSHLTERLEYDAKGNIVRDGAADVAIGPMDQPMRVGDEPIAYDALGNMTSLPGALGRIACRWGEDGTLAEARIGERTVRYEYDPLGRRVLKTDGVRSWRYGWVGHQLLWEEFHEAPGAKGIRRDYLWCPDSFVPLAFREGERTYWIQCDARGAPIRVFRQDGTVAWSARYDAFGNATVDVEHVRQPWRLLGQYADAETGLHYSLCRYYSPRIKSFLSRDPLWHEPGASNYGYAKNSPYQYADPFGGPFFLLAAVAAVAVGAVVGGIVGGIVSKATGGSFWAGALDGAMSGAGAVVGGIVGGMLGGPVGMVAGAMAGSALGAGAASLTQNLIDGDPLCWKCALKTAAVSLAIDIALLGLGKIPGVRRLARALGNKLKGKGDAIKKWVKQQIARRRGAAWARRQASKVDPEDLAKAKELEPKYAARKEQVRDMYNNYDDVPPGARPDVDKARLDKAVVGDPPGNRRALTWKSDAEYKEFQDDVAKAFKDAGVDDAVVQQVGSGTSGWSGNPTKPYIDVDGKGYPKPWSKASDTDFAVFSKDAMAQAQTQNVPLNHKNVLDDRYAVFKNGEPGQGQMADTPLGKELSKVREKWNDRLYGDQMEKMRVEKNLSPEQFQEMRQKWDGVDFKVNTTSQPFPDSQGGPITVLSQRGGG